MLTYTDEDTVLFGTDYYSSLGVDEEDHEPVVVDSCLNSSGSNSRDVGEDDEEQDYFGVGEEDQVHFFPTTIAADVAAMGEGQVGPQWAAAIKQEKEEKQHEEQQAAPGAPSLPHLKVKLEDVQEFLNNNNNNCSVVSTPDVVNDVIMLEDLELFKRQQAENNFIEVGDLSRRIL